MGSVLMHLADSRVAALLVRRTGFGADPFDDLDAAQIAGPRSRFGLSGVRDAVGVLFVLFLILKVTHVVAWSWFWITSPLWVAAIAFVALLVAAVLIAAGGRRR